MTKNYDQETVEQQPAQGTYSQGFGGTPIDETNSLVTRNPAPDAAPTASAIGIRTFSTRR